MGEEGHGMIGKGSIHQKRSKCFLGSRVRGEALLLPWHSDFGHRGVTFLGSPMQAETTPFPQKNSEYRIISPWAIFLTSALNRGVG